MHVFPTCGSPTNEIDIDVLASIYDQYVSKYVLFASYAVPVTCLAQIFTFFQKCQFFVFAKFSYIAPEFGPRSLQLTQK